MSFSHSRRARGFSIIELLIVIVIVSILAAIALPSYRQYVMRTNRTVAKAALQDLIVRQEGYAVDHKGYAIDFERLGITGASGASADSAYVRSDGSISRDSANALYSFALHTSAAGSAMSAACASLSAGGLSGTPNAFGISATPVGSNSDTRCGTLCASSRGERGASGPGGVADCWRR